jgi:2-dehydro-3-deoxygluconokinase
MLRLSVLGNLRFSQANQFNVHFGGGEANVAIGLANFGHQTTFVSKLPKNDLGDSCMRFLSSRNVNTTNIVRGGDRIGIYFLETGASMRPSNVIYDRKGSSFSESSIKEYHWDEIFKDANWFHITGITPALGDQTKEITEYALMEAKKRGITTSVDLNFRRKLWTDQQAQQTMIPLMKYVDVCIGNEEDASLVLGIKSQNSNVLKGDINIEDYVVMLKEMIDRFHFKYVATSLRTSHSASNNDWQGVLYDGSHYYVSQKYSIHPIIDRIGGGDAFAAGLIHGLLNYDNQKSIEFATAASALKHTIVGDSNDVTISEVESLIQGNASGRVKR